MTPNQAAEFGHALKTYFERIATALERLATAFEVQPDFIGLHEPVPAPPPVAAPPTAESPPAEPAHAAGPFKSPNFQSFADMASVKDIFNTAAQKPQDYTFEQVKSVIMAVNEREGWEAAGRILTSLPSKPKF